jgi:hypothetical protein
MFGDYLDLSEDSRLLEVRLLAYSNKIPPV